MRARIVSIREANHVDGDVAEDIFVVKSGADRLTDLGQVNLGQTSLRREATDVDHFCATEFIVRANQLDKTIRLNQERD